MISTLALAAVLAQGHYTPNEAQAIFSQANDAYYKENFALAQEGYLKLLNNGYKSPDVLFNLGTSYLAQGQLGEAVLYLERARLAEPSAQEGADIAANLAVARTPQLGQVVGAQTDEPFLQRLATAVPEKMVGFAFVSLWAVGFLLLFLFQLKSLRRTAVAVLSGLALMAAVPCGALLGARMVVEQTVTEAVILAATQKAREFPKEAAKVSFEIHAGLKVRLLETSGKFVKIRLPNGLEGWTEKDGIVEI
jgi:tetratricopeptide (TPR) repeat protein